MENLSYGKMGGLMDVRDSDLMLVQDEPTMEQIVEYLLDDFCLADYIYDVRDDEGLGWNGKKVLFFNSCIERLKLFIGR